ncbi:MAG TPA: hypothetical protein VG291_18200 [Xanthobacteraceae bacterium]|nr:hypothetical protein [Xanthobacteraceae bacterium]
MSVKASLLVIAGLLCGVSAAPAASVTISDTASGLPGVALDATAMLVDAGLPVRSSGGGKLTVEVKGLHCDSRSNGPLVAADPHAGLPTLKCRINAKNEKDSRSGQPFAEARAMTDLLQKIQDAKGNGGVAFGDCAMGGYCGTFARSISCTIDTMVENFINGGRWTCTFTDGQ